ncbi:MAG: hypothetical protein K2I34_03350, partial [Paramuribaculum sp.]|nr:hypothetical protein [Paramuribaculum sp.]
MSPDRQATATYTDAATPTATASVSGAPSIPVSDVTPTADPHATPDTASTRIMSRNGSSRDTPTP